MALAANLLLPRPDVLSHNPFCGLQVSHIPCLREFRRPGSNGDFFTRPRSVTKCNVGGPDSPNHHLNGLPQSHITALDNRAGVEELLALLRSKQSGKSTRSSCVCLCILGSLSLSQFAAAQPNSPGLQIALLDLELYSWLEQDQVTLAC